MLYLLYRFARWLCLCLPLERSYKIAELVADAYRLLAFRDILNLEDNLRIVLQTDDKAILRSHIKNVFRNFAKYLVDFFRFSKLTRDYLLSHLALRGKENIDKLLARGKGVIVLTAHIGNWELGGAVISSLGYPFYAIALEHKDKKINNFFLEQRSFADVRVIPIGAQLKQCFRVLRQNKILGILGDRDFSNHGVPAIFFGRPTILPRGPAFFSLRTGAGIVPTFLIRGKDNKFSMIFEKPIEKIETKNNEDAIKDLMERYIAVIEKYVRLYPDQWYVFRRVWN